MSNILTSKQAAAMLQATDDILILCHNYPDGDTLGSGFGLCRALRSLGKRARVACADPIPEKYHYMWAGLPTEEFEPAFICAVDVADPKLLGSLSDLADRVELCIDHHGTNTRYAKNLRLESAPAAAMLVYEVIGELGVPMTAEIAACIYTGVATDTGCFKFANTNPAAHRAAAELMAYDFGAEDINYAMFDLKSRARIELERQALAGMGFYLEGRCAVITITRDMVTATGALEDDMEGLSPIPRQIEGVWAGVTLRERADGSYKVSVRTGHHVNAATVCARLGGGGHTRAAGCTLTGTRESVIKEVIETIEGQIM